ncbi:MAG TPA: ComF family protein [Bacteroidales bacterium]|nr:ComF family protein [Bacteroidales bacterium]HQP05138.1 ComF family protein [Bacteroidales bacterium]
MKNIEKWACDLVYLLFPEVCEVCMAPLVTGEKTICLKCLADMPYTDYHNKPENPVSQIFWGKVHVEMATALFYFAKGSKYRKLIHKLKYKGKREIGIFLGRELGACIGKSDYFKGIDCIIPVPLHISRQTKRGYNQSAEIALGISQVTGIPVKLHELIRSQATETQTKKTRDERWKNVSGKFQIASPENLKGKHVLVVDDVITTGSTIEAVVETLLGVEGVTVSIAVVAKA